MDRDFDDALNEGNNIFELDCYSIENLICTEEVLESLLRDEFRKGGEPLERQRIVQAFLQARSSFSMICAPINFMLFAARRLKLRVLRKPEKSSEIASVSIQSVTQAYINLSDVIDIAGLPGEQVLNPLKSEFEALPEPLQQRGKYILDFFRRWLKVLVEDLRNPVPILFSRPDPRLPGEPNGAGLRRLASSVPVPNSLKQFILTVVIPGARINSPV